MKKILLLLITFFVTLYAQKSVEYVTPKMFIEKSKTLLQSELLYGYGSASIKDAGTTEENYTITTYTLLNEHQNLSQKPLNYNYEATLSSSNTATQYDTFDFEAGVGYNIIDISAQEYISMGVTGGYSTLNAAYHNRDKKKDFYKLGVRISFAKALFKRYIYAYGTTNYLKTQRDDTLSAAKIGLRLHLPQYTNFILITGLRYSYFRAKEQKRENSSNYIGLSYIF